MNEQLKVEALEIYDRLSSIMFNGKLQLSVGRMIKHKPIPINLKRGNMEDLNISQKDVEDAMRLRHIIEANHDEIMRKDVAGIILTDEEDNFISNSDINTLFENNLIKDNNVLESKIYLLLKLNEELKSIVKGNILLNELTRNKRKDSKIDILLQKKEFQAIFAKAIEAGLIEKTTAGYQWKDNKQLLAYFAQKISRQFHLSNKCYNGEYGVNWKIFESAFNVERLKDAKQSWLKDNYNESENFYPKGFEKIDQLFSKQ
jgi:hypothetical protein